MKYTLEIVDRDNNLVNLTEKEKKEILMQKINQAMELIGFQKSKNIA